MLNRLLKLFSRNSERPLVQTICGTPLIQSGELKLIDEVASEPMASSNSSESNSTHEVCSYLPPPAWIDTDKGSSKSKSGK